MTIRQPLSSEAEKWAAHPSRAISPNQGKGNPAHHKGETT